MSHFLQLFAEKFTKTPRHGSFLEKLQVLAKSMIFRAFSRNEPLFATFSWKVDQNAETWLFPRKVASFGQMDDFSFFFEKWATFCNFLLKSWPNAETWLFPRKVASFGQMDDFSAKSESFREKARKIIDLAKTNNFSSKLPCLGVLVSFSAKSCKKWLISRKRTKNHPFGQNLQLFEETTMFRRFGQLFSKKLQKVAHFDKVHEKSSILPKLATFRENYHVSAFWWTFQQKVAKSGSFRPEARHRFAQNLQLFDETTMFRRFGHFFRKKLQKRAHFVKKHEKSSIWPKLATLRENYHLSAFWSIFQQKVAKSGSFRGKERNIMDLAKSCHFSSKLPCFRVLVNFSAKRWKKWLISWKMTKNHRFGLNLQLFEETTMFRRFCQLFSKKLQKVAHFVKEHEKSSIWPKLATFRANYHVSAFWWTFEQKVSHFVKKNEKSSIWPKLTTSRTNYHVSAFWSAFQQKVVKSIVGAYQAQAIITGFATSICSFHLCRDWGNDFWNYVSRSTGVLG